MSKVKYGVNVSRLFCKASVIMGDGRTRQVTGVNQYGFPAIMFGYQNDDKPLVLDVIGKTERELGLKVGIHFHNKESLDNCIGALQSLRDEYFKQEDANDSKTN